MELKGYINILKCKSKNYFTRKCFTKNIINCSGVLRIDIMKTDHCMTANVSVH